ncbi:MAG: hypothetical protein JWM95_5249 [Gemmatimonadetes bacterium]|nr:hypothetical protein [Gemmatimonadota bacterium]
MRCHATEFLERIALMDPGEWTARALECSLAVSPQLETALEHALKQEASAFDAWSVRDDVETLLFRLMSTVPHAILASSEAKAPAPTPRTGAGRG